MLAGIATHTAALSRIKAQQAGQLPPLHPKRPQPPTPTHSRRISDQDLTRIASELRPSTEELAIEYFNERVTAIHKRVFLENVPPIQGIRTVVHAHDYLQCDVLPITESLLSDPRLKLLETSKAQLTSLISKANVQIQMIQQQLSEVGFPERTPDHLTKSHFTALQEALALEKKFSEALQDMERALEKFKGGELPSIANQEEFDNFKAFLAKVQKFLPDIDQWQNDLSNLDHADSAQQLNSFDQEESSRFILTAAKAVVAAGRVIDRITSFYEYIEDLCKKHPHSARSLGRLSELEVNLIYALRLKIDCQLLYDRLKPKWPSSVDEDSGTFDH